MDTKKFIMFIQLAILMNF